MSPGPRRIDLQMLFDLAAAASPVEAVDVLADGLAIALGARSASFLIMDLSGRGVARFAGTHANAANALQHGARHVPFVRLAGTVYDAVLRSGSPFLARVGPGEGDDHRLVVPVVDHGERLGVLELTLPWYPTGPDVAAIASAATALAHVLVTTSRYTDLAEWAQRRTPFTLAAEIQRRLLPGAYTCETGQFTLAGWLEPANAAGGDTFDYALDRDTLHVSITDAVGHDVDAALLATVLVGSLRNSRRRQDGLGEQARRAGEALARHSAVGQFVTGQLLRVGRASGLVDLVNAGHPFPLLLRAGQVREVELAIDMPFGIRPDRDFRIQHLVLEPGDRLLLVTDGILERNAESFDLAEALRRTAGAHPRDVVFSIGEDVLAATGGNLRDDATAICLDWHPR